MYNISILQTGVKKKADTYHIALSYNFVSGKEGKLPQYALTSSSFLCHQSRSFIVNPCIVLVLSNTHNAILYSSRPKILYYKIKSLGQKIKQVHSALYLK